MYFVFLSIIIFSCKEKSNPTSNQPILPVSKVDSSGLYLGLNDTCSYRFIKDFLSNYDSVQVLDANFYVQLYLYADSGDNDYWDDFFEKDSVINNLYFFNSNDSLIIEIRYFNYDVNLEEYNTFLTNQSNYLHFMKSVEEAKSVVIFVPQKPGVNWAEEFQQYSFINEIQWIISITGSIF